MESIPLPAAPQPIRGGTNHILWEQHFVHVVNSVRLLFFITRMEGDRAIPEGLCLKCARELNIAPINQMLDKMNLSDEDLESMTEEVMSLDGRRQ